MNLIKKNLLLPALTLLNISFAGLTSQAAEGMNTHFDIHDNGGVALNYQNLGCQIKRVEEFMQEGVPLGVGAVYADGNESACLSLCAYWKDTFTKKSNGSSYLWETKVFRNFPNKQTYIYQNGTRSLTSQFVCQTEFSPTLDNPVYCGPDASSTSVCNPTTVTHPIPLPTCSMTLNTTIGTPSTGFIIKSRSASSVALSCELNHDGVVKPIDCNGANYSLGKTSVGTHNVKFIAKGFGGDKVCSQNYTVYKPVSCTVKANVYNLSLASNTKTTVTWSSSGDINTCDYYKDGELMQAGVACSGSSTSFTKDLFTTTGSHYIELNLRGKGGDPAWCRANFNVK